MTAAAVKSMRCETIEETDLPSVTRNLPVQVWNSPVAARLYSTTLSLACFSRRGRVIGMWVCPLSGHNRPAAQRDSRLLPYASPWVDAKLHATVRHRVVTAMAGTLMGKVDAIELPMEPYFSEVAALLEAGIDVLCRHTRMLSIGSLEDVRAGYLPTVRNHIRVARKRHIVKRVTVEHFDFSRAIVGQPQAAVVARCRSGLEISRQNPTLCLAAVDSEGFCRGQALILGWKDGAVLMHSWFDHAGTRGVPSLLVDTAISICAQEWRTAVFDFEGSVIPSIDQFMRGFGAYAVAYPQARWMRSAPSLLEYG